MSIASEITKLNQNLNDSYDVCRDMDAEMPEQENFDNLPDTIGSIPRDFYATLTVTTETGATVEYNGHTQEATEGTASFQVYKFGYAYATATLGTVSRSGSIYIYSSGIYSLNLALSSKIVAYAPEGTSVTFNGVTKIVDAGGAVDFTVYGTGSYDVVAEKNGITKTNRVQVYEYGQTYSTTFVFDADLNIYTHTGADVIFNGLRKTATTGKVTFKFSATGTYKITVIHNGNAKIEDVVLASVADTDVDIYIVPNAYQQVEYLGVPNTAYINTEFYPTQNTELKIKASHDGSSYSSGDLGQVGTCRWTGNPFWTFGIYPRDVISGVGATTFFYGTYYSSGGYTGYVILNDTTNTTDVFEYNLGLTSVSVKNLNTGSVKSATITRNQTFTSTQPLWVGAFNNQGSRLSVNYGSHIYYAIIKESGSVVRHLIPCKRVSDNVLGMYDVVNDVFYTNSGTGTFTAGPVVTPALPSEYQQVEYLQSSGTQYIDTGVNNTTSVSQLNIKVKFEIQSSSITMAGVWGWANRNATTLANDLGFNCVQLSNGRPNLFHYFFTVSTNQISPQLLYYNTVYYLECEYKNNISKVICNNQTQTYDNTTATKYITNNIYLFASNDPSVVTGKFIGKIYSCSIELNNVVVRNLVPCYRKSDSVAGMYDTVNGVFYTNSGSGTFTVGPIVGSLFCLPSEYTYRKYVASTSDKTQYLDLDETGTNTTGMLMKVYDELEDITKDCVYAGGRATANGRLWIGGSYYGDVQAFFSYLGWNVLKRLSTSGSQYSKNISATKKLRTFYVNYLNNRQEGYDDTKAFDIDQTLIQNTSNLYAFGANNQGSFGISAWIRLYYLILTSGTNISNIFIPCYRNSDNVIGMYDIVKGNFKTNAGSGTFVDGGYLPSTYQQVEYLESSGTQYITLDYLTEANRLEIDLEATLPVLSGEQDIIGNQPAENNRFIVGFYKPSGYTCFGYSCTNVGNDGNAAIDNLTLGNHHINMVYDTENNYKTLTIDGVSNTVNKCTNISNTYRPITIFAGTNKSGYEKYYSGQIKYVKLRKNGNMIYNLVPCYRKSDNVAGMFDTENMIFYTNSGTGSFTAGPDVN